MRVTAIRKLKDMVLLLLRQGMTPARVALCIICGVAISIFPVVGVPTLLATAVALTFRLNLPLIQIVNYVAAPLQWLSVIPFLRLGEVVCGADPLPLSPAQLAEALKSDPFGFMKEFSGALWHASVGWLVTVPPLVLLLILIVRPVMARWWPASDAASKGEA